MGNLLNSLTTVADSMRATQLAIELAGNNVSNAKTPNFAKQRLDLQAKRFEVDGGLSGGVRSNGNVSSRKDYLEQAVQQQNSRYGRLAQLTAGLERLEPVFDVANGAGLGTSIDRLFESFSAWSVSPNDSTSREAVLTSARNLAQGFRSTLANLASATAGAQGEINGTVDRINQIGEQIQQYNLLVRSDVRHLSDPGLEAGIHQQLESLSELVGYDVIRSEDGSLTVNLGGQTPLTVGASYFPVSVDVSGSDLVLRNAQGGDITSHIQQGRLGAQLEQRNGFLPTLAVDLNRLAATLADSVNSVLAGGLDRNGNAPATGLFTYDATAGAAATLAITNLTPDELAAASASSPGSNGNALALADLARSPLIDGSPPSQFFGILAGRVGRALADSRSDQSTQSLLLAQARNVRADETEVNIDEEAANLVAFQRQYEANAELIRILNSLTETTINIIR